MEESREVVLRRQMPRSVNKGYAWQALTSNRKFSTAVEDCLLAKAVDFVEQPCCMGRIHVIVHSTVSWRLPICLE